MMLRIVARAQPTEMIPTTGVLLTGNPDPHLRVTAQAVGMRPSSSAVRRAVMMR
jgi:hypothetical protein